MSKPQRRRAIATHLFAVVTILGLGAQPALAQAPAQPSGSTANPAASPAHEGLVEESTFLTVTSPKGSYRLEAVIVRPAKARRPPAGRADHPRQGPAQGRHGQHPCRPDAAAGARLRASRLSRRRRGAARLRPFRRNARRRHQCALREMLARRSATLFRDRVERPGSGVARHRGTSAGGRRAHDCGRRLGWRRRGAGARGPQAQGAGGRGQSCRRHAADRRRPGPLSARPRRRSRRSRRFGSAKLPSLWIYSENDDVSAQDNIRKLHQAYTGAGGLADLHIIPALQPSGHFVFDLPQGRAHWLPHLDQFLRANNLPTWNPGQVDALMRSARLSPTNRAHGRDVFLALHAQGPGRGRRLPSPMRRTRATSPPRGPPGWSNAGSAPVRPAGSSRRISRRRRGERPGRTAAAATGPD